MNALILAAGYSSRMGSFKPLLMLGGKPVIRRVIEAIQTADNCACISVVTGHRREEILPYLTDVSEIYNSRYADGMFSSVQAGVGDLIKRGADCVLMTPADYPLLTVSEEQLALSDSGKIVIPVYNDEEGHPVSLPSWLFPHIMSSSGEGGLRQLLSNFEDKIIRVPVTNIGAVMDMDTPDDYQRMQDLIN